MNSRSDISFAEFVALMAMMMSLTALAIDAMLPALSEIGEEMGVAHPNDGQLIISNLFLGLGIGQLFYGPLSDNIGRRPAILFGFLIFTVGSLMAIFTSSFELILIARILQGLGLSGPRIVSIAIIRDKFKGEAMAQVMSFTMLVFIIVPMLAPVLGQAVMLFWDWKMIFNVILGFGCLVCLWFMIRQSETLPKEKRIKFSFKALFHGTKEVVSNRSTLGYTLAAGCISGAFIGFLNTSQQLLQQRYELGEQFPLYFALVAFSIGIASLVNSKLVKRMGMRTMVNFATIALSITSSLFFVYTLFFSALPSLPIFLAYLVITVFFTGIQFGNYNSLAMEPLGHIAGIGAAVVGSISTVLAVPLGTYIGKLYDETVVPLVGGFFVLGLITLICSLWAKGAKVNEFS